MSMDNIFGIAGSALNAQMVRMNISASNMANAGSTASSEADAYKAKRPVFEALLSEQQANMSQNNLGGVKVVGLADDQTRGCQSRRTCGRSDRPWANPRSR